MPHVGGLAGRPDRELRLAYLGRADLLGGLKEREVIAADVVGKRFAGLV